MGCIYKITNTVNGKIYIGQTVGKAEKRWRQHIRDSAYEYKDSYNCPFHRAIRKYGSDSFVVDTIELCSDDVLNDREVFWIKHYGSFGTGLGYNATSGGNAPTDVSDETRVKISLAESGERNHYYGKHLSAEHRRKIGDSQRGELSHNYGVPHTNEERKKIKATESSPVACYNDVGVYMYFLSSMAAMRERKFDCGHISACINGKRKTAYKDDNGMPLYWRLATDEESSVIKDYFLTHGCESMEPGLYIRMKEECCNA